LRPSAIRRDFDGTTGTPVAYALISGGIRLVPPPSSSLLVTMDYWARIDALSTANPSNWLLEKHPDAYLYGTLFYAEAHLDNATRAGQWKSLLDETIGRINRAAATTATAPGRWCRASPAQVRGASC
jgi:hypothetical protein